MSLKTGKVTVTTENIFPVIRQWLYSDQDIFIRELVSNCCDAVAKFKRLVELGQAEASEDEKYSINVIYDDVNKTIAFEDNGIGMTAEEIDKYINQIAFSGAMDFVTKYQEQSTDKAGIIGHFGLGFYSAFMVADGGTIIALKLSDEAKEIFNGSKIREILRKYCSFVPTEIYFTDVEADRKAAEAEEKRRKEKEEKGEEYVAPDNTPKALNDPSPLWAKKPSECTEEEYKQFYHNVFPDMRDPLFWIHLNMDYPFNLQGILYFPKTDNVYQSLEGRIKIYNHQVFVADNIEEIIPDFLFLLKGCLDCSDLPLNVSRSALQQDEYVKKLSSHIIKKVSDKLNEVFKNDRASFEKYWSDISVFVKYGMMKDEKFYEKTKDICLFKLNGGGFATLSELTEGKDTIRYTTDPIAQAAYISMAEKDGFKVIILDEELDNNFISFLEYKYQNFKFKRVDSELSGTEGDTEVKDKLTDLFRVALGNDKLEVSVMGLGKDTMPAFIRETEEARRMAEMREQFEKMRTGSEDDPYKDLDSMFPIKEDLVINTDSELISKLEAMKELGTKDEEVNRLAQHVFDQAKLAHGSLDSEGLKRFLEYNSKLLEKTIE